MVWAGRFPSWWAMWVITCLNLIKIACICNYTYRIGGMPRGRSPHDPPRRKRMTHAKDPRAPTQSPTPKPHAEGLQPAVLIWTRVGVAHMTHTSPCGHMTHMTHDHWVCNLVGVAHTTHRPQLWRHVAVQHTCLVNGCLVNGCLVNGCLGNGCLGNGCLVKEGGGRARRRPVTLAKGPRTIFFILQTM